MLSMGRLLCSVSLLLFGLTSCLSAGSGSLSYAYAVNTQLHELQVLDQRAGLRFRASCEQQDSRIELRRLTLACTGGPLLSIGSLTSRGLPKLLEHPFTKSLNLSSSSLSASSSVPAGASVLCLDLGRISAAYVPDTGQMGLLLVQRIQDEYFEAFLGRSEPDGSRPIISGGLRQRHTGPAGDLEMVQAFTLQEHSDPAILHQISLGCHLPQLDCEGVCRYCSENLFERSSYLSPIQSNESLKATALFGSKVSMELSMQRSSYYDARIVFELKDSLKAPGLSISRLYSYRADREIRAVIRTVREYSVAADAGVLRIKAKRIEKGLASEGSVCQCAVLSVVLKGWEVSCEISREDGEHSRRMSLLYKEEGRKFAVCADSLQIKFPL